MFLLSADFFTKLTFSKKIFQEHYQRVPNGLDPEHPTFCLFVLESIGKLQLFVCLI